MINYRPELGLTKNQNSMLKISVITPVLNSFKYIDQSIQSTLIQNYTNFEHIIIDGGSTDGTLDILGKYQHLVVRSEKDSGQPNAMNKGLALSTGDIIVFLNADDFFEPQAFSLANDYLSLSTENFIVGGLYMVDEFSKRLPGYENLLERTSVDFYGMLKWWKNPVPYNPSSYFYKRNVVEKVGLFNENLHFTHDYDFLLRVSMNFYIRKIDQYLGNYRYIAGTKTFDSHLSNHWLSQMKFARNYWNLVPNGKKLTLQISYLLGMMRIRLQILKRVTNNAIS